MLLMAIPGEYDIAQGPQVTIRQIKKDSVDFVLSNVDLAYPLPSQTPKLAEQTDLQTRSDGLYSPSCRLWVFPELQAWD